jgi:hypothetical protein
LYAFVQDVPIDEGLYKRVTDGLGPEPPKGLVAHVVIKRAEGGLRYIDVWESEEDWDHFAEERLHPVVHPLLQGVFGQELPREPERVPLSVIHVWGDTRLFG